MISAGGARLVLASGSPRRLALLRKAGFDPRPVPSGLAEDEAPGESPEELARRLAEAKARAVAGVERDETGSPVVVLGADTVVALGDQGLGKPEDPEEAAAMLRRLSGRPHRVVTGVALVGPRPAQVEVFSVATEVRFRALSEAEVVAYAATGEGMDKAGGYGIQGGAASFVAAIEGSYTNVVGLPLAETVEALEARRVPRRFSGGTSEPRGLG